MLVSALEIVNAFPNEKIRIHAPKTVPTINSIRFDSMFKRQYSADQINSTTNILTSTPFPSYDLSPDDHHVSFSYPKRFPLSWNVDIDNDQFFEAEIIDRNGVTGVSVFPTHPFPKIIGYNDYSISLSSVLLTAHFLNESSVNLDWNGYDITYDNLLDDPTKKFKNFTTFMYMPCAYFGGSRKNEVFTTITHEVSTLSGDFLDKILPYSFEVVVPITNIDPAQSPVGYTGDSTYHIFDPNRDGLLKGRKRSDLLANPVSANINYATGEFGLDYNHGYFVSAGNATVSYRTSSYATPTLGAYNSSDVVIPIPGNLGTDYFKLSSSLPIYFYNIPLTFQGTALANNKGPTIFWNFVNNTVNNGTSAVTLSSGMRDNFKQGWWNLKNSGTNAMLYYEDLTLSDNLSCYVNGNYVAPTQQVPASSDFVFVNDGLFQTYTVNMVLSTFTDSVQKKENKFTLNSDQANFTINLTSFDTSLIAEIESDAFMSSSYPVKWNFNLPDNIELYSLVNGEPIQLNTDCNLATAYIVSAINMGIEDTEVIHYNSEYGVSSVVIWEPSEDSFLNLKTAMSGIYVDKQEIPKGNLVTYLKRGNLNYRVPDDAYVKWLLVTTDTIDVQASGLSSEIFFNDNYYTGEEGRSINFEVSAGCALVNPRNIAMSFHNMVFNDYFSLSSNYRLTYNATEKPCGSNIWFTLSGDTGSYQSSDSCSTAVISAGTHVFNLSADLSTLNAPASSIWWFVNDNLVASGYELTGVNISSLVNATSCLTVSAKQVSAKTGNFPIQNYSDKFCFCIKEVLTPFDFIVYPDQQWNGTNFETVTSSTQSNGPSAYGRCHSQCFTISATPGFDEYHYKIGDNVIVDDSNVLNHCHSFETTGTASISITAFDECYDNKCRATEYNSVSSVDGDILRDSLRFYDYENPTNDFKINDTVFNLNSAFDEKLIQLTATVDYGSSPVKMASANLVLTLTDIEGKTKTTEVVLIGNDNILQNNWTLEDPNAVFYLEENTVGEFTLDITGTLTQVIPDQDYCSKTITFPTTSFQLTALHGPEIGFYTEKGCLTTNESFIIKNQSKIIDNQFGLSTIYIDFGDNRVSAVPAEQTTISHQYSANGNYTWTLTGELRNGLQNIVTLGNEIVVTDRQIDPDQEIQRNFPSNISLPFTNADIGDLSNDWINAYNFNERLERIRLNFEYVKQQSYMYDPLLPIRHLGWYGNKKSSIVKFNRGAYDKQDQFEFTNITDIVQSSGNLLMIDDNKLKIYENGYYPRLIVDKSKIGEDESWIDLKSIQYQNGVVGALDKGNHAIYFYKWTGNYKLKLLYYFGGWGNSSSKYKFNKPNDFSYESDRIIVCDTENNALKSFDGTFSWVRTEIYGAKPLSVDVNSQGIYVLFSDSTIYKFDFNFNLKELWKFEGKIFDYTKLRVNEDFVFVNGEVVYKYTLKGSLIGKFRNEIEGHDIQALGFSDGTIYLASKNLIHKVCDNTTYYSLRDLDKDTELHPFSAIEIDPNELVTVDVYNDSFTKIFENQKTLVDSFSARFFEIQSPCDDQFVSFETRPFVNETPLVSALIGYNECMTYETIGREFNLIGQNFDVITDILKSETTYPVFSAECLTWENVSIQSEHCANGGNHKPLSWYEIVHGLECPEHGECYNNYFTYFSEISTLSAYFQIPYSIGACEYVTTNFTGVTCNSASGLIFFSREQ